MSFRDTRLPARFWSKIDADDCWIWTAAHYADGYGAYSVDRVMKRAHRVAYEALMGPIPDGLELDHLCRIRDCVNPAHLEPVTRRENNLRWMRADGVKAGATHCIRGHEFTPDNTDCRQGRRRCRECKRVSDRARYQTRRRVAV